MNKKLAIGLISLSVLALGLSGYNFIRPTTTEIIKETIKEIGAMPGDSLPGPEFSVGGVKEYNYSGPFNSGTYGTTTLFSVKSPSSTSSLVFISMQDTVGTGTAATWVVASSTSRWATTTASNITSTVFTVAASAQESFVWTPLGGSVRDMIIPPNTWILGKTEGVPYSGNTAVGYIYTGTYRLKFIELK